MFKVWSECEQLGSKLSSSIDYEMVLHSSLQKKDLRLVHTIRMKWRIIRYDEAKQRCAKGELNQQLSMQKCERHQPLVGYNVQSGNNANMTKYNQLLIFTLLLKLIVAS